MAGNCIAGAAGAVRRVSGLLAASVSCLMLAACSQVGSGPGDLLGLQSTAAAPTTTASISNANLGDLQKATEYWGKAYAQNPRDAQTALNYARNLKAMGEKQQALAVLQQASMFHGSHRGIVGEYGRLALDMNQVTLAQKLLEQADDPANPDWRIISARGTAMAKQGLYRNAIPLYERALALAPNQPSALSNLALAYAMEGHADKAEPLLKQAVAAGSDDPRVHQNLALVLGLQGKYDEAKVTAANSLPADRASSNVDFVRAMVKAEPKPLAVEITPAKPVRDRSRQAGRCTHGRRCDRSKEVPASWSTQVAVAKGKP